MWPALGRDAIASETAGETAAPPTARAFSLDDVAEMARQRAARPFEPARTELPEAIADLTYDQYRNIRFRPEARIWSGEPVNFQLDFFHLGFYYKEPVKISIVENGVPAELAFSADMFSYDGDVTPPTGDLSHLGFAGFRVRYPINAQDVFDEFLVFQGASYFRAIGRNLLYGLSARGLAIDTAEPSGEEFPSFQEFWIEKPATTDNALVVYALLDSPSAAGAFRFAVNPGAETVMDVRAELFPRAEVKKLGLAPLTSMFLFNGMNRSGFDDFRPAVHDSDGLQILTGRGEWLWRPLGNPQTLQISYFKDNRPRGFGLMQRARTLEAFADMEANYHRRPSLWIEPLGDWGQGFVELVEIPTDREINDNIVAYWRPERPVPAGGSLSLSYRMRWTDDVLPPPELLWVVTSRTGLNFEHDRRLFVVDFKPRSGTPVPDAETFQLDLSASRGTLMHAQIHAAQPDGTLRVTFELDPDGETMSELRLALTRDGRPASETWLYRWIAA